MVADLSKNVNTVQNLPLAIQNGFHVIGGKKIFVSVTL